MAHEIRDLALADRGQHRIAWAARNMPVLRQVTAEFAASRPFEGRRIAAALHITPETAVLMRALQAGGAQIALCASNPLSTRDDICAALVVSLPAWAKKPKPEPMSAPSIDTKSPSVVKTSINCRSLAPMLLRIPICLDF